MHYGHQSHCRIIIAITGITDSMAIMAVMTNISKVAKLIDNEVISCIMVIRAIVAIRIIMDITGIQTAWPLPQLWL